LRTISQLVETAFQRGVKTLVAVGSEETLHDVINAVKGREVVIGFIPLVDCEIGEILGAKDIAQGAKTIGARRIAELDLGSAQNPRRVMLQEIETEEGVVPIPRVEPGNFFLAKLSFGLGLNQNFDKRLSGLNLKLLQSLFNLPTFDVKFSVDGQYQASLKVVGGMIVNGLTTGMLDVALLPQLSKWQTFKYRKEILSGRYELIPGSSLIHVKKIEILNPAGLPLRSGSRVIAKSPSIIEILPRAIKIIVGKDRKFN
jgi:diacylglycerol kinase family enzyme